METVVVGLLEDVSLGVRQCFWFQHDGGLAHNGEDIRQWLKAAYSGRWIGRGGTVAWHLQSPYITPIISYLWAHLKKQIYAVPPRTIGHLVTQYFGQLWQWSMPTCLKQEEVESNTYCRLWDTHGRTITDTFCHLTWVGISKNRRLRTYIVLHSGLCNTETFYGQLVREFHFILHMQL
jgi:hypothetical protein